MTPVVDSVSSLVHHLQTLSEKQMAMCVAQARSTEQLVLSILLILTAVATVVASFVGAFLGSPYLALFSLVGIVLAVIAAMIFLRAGLPFQERSPYKDLFTIAQLDLLKAIRPQELLTQVPSIRKSN